MVYTYAKGEEGHEGDGVSAEAPVQCPGRWVVHIVHQIVFIGLELFSVSRMSLSLPLHTGSRINLEQLGRPMGRETCL